MPQLARYVLAEVLQVFLLVVTVLTAMLLLVGVGKEALEHGLGLGPIARLMPYILPKALLFAVPATVLFAVTSVFGRMSAAGEITALKALGISPTGILMPIGVLTIVLSLLTFCLNDVAFSWSEQGIKRVVTDAVEEIAYSVLRTKKSFYSPQFSVTVMRVEGRRLISPTFSFQGGATSRQVMVRAREAELRSNPGSGVLLVICRDGSIEMDGNTFEFSDTFEREIRLMDVGDTSGESPSRLSLSTLAERTPKQAKLIERLEQQQAAGAALALTSGDFLRLAGPAAAGRRQTLADARTTLYRMRTEPPRRWANGFSCLCFALVGVPMAIRRRHSEIMATFFACFLPTLVAYYPLLMFAVDRAKAGALPPVTVWLGNIVFALWGLWLFRRVYRY